MATNKFRNNYDNIFSGEEKNIKVQKDFATRKKVSGNMAIC